jgi:EAL domain-containing protein (putative c-di-GMP-specific phosphodiesterase class I)
LAKKQHESYLIYDESLNIEKQYQENIEWIEKLKIAIDNDKIVPFFQPIFDNKSGKIVSCECLIRLIDDEENVISPYKFLSAAKKSRLYNTLTEIMISKSCEYFEDIACDFSVNLAIADMLNEDIKEYIRYKIKKHNVSQKIVLEILETEGIENYDEIVTFIDEMKALGCRIAIDDFGSGYSNFEYLLKLNIDYIKIDGSLIRNIDKDKNAQIVAQTVVDFAEKLGVITIAEFVHNKAVLEKVKEFHIDRSQGFYLAEPQKDVRELILAQHTS